MNARETRHDDPVDGERRRVIVIGGQRVGRDAIVEFEDLDRPGRAYRAVVLQRKTKGGLAIGDQCLIRYREAHRFRTLSQPAAWLFVERTDDSHVDFDAEVEAITAHAGA